MMELKVSKLKSFEEAMTNHAFFSPRRFEELRRLNKAQTPVYVKLNDRIYVASQATHVEEDAVGLSQKQRENLKLSLTLDRATVSIFSLPSTEYRLALVRVELQPFRLDQSRDLGQEPIERAFRGLYTGQFFSTGQDVFFETEGIQVYGHVMHIALIDSEARRADLPYGAVCSDTQIEFSSRNTNLRVRGSTTALRSIVRADFKFEELGVGGLDREIADIFRRAFSSRRIPTHMLELYGIKHVKGLLLYGPPGTGKTLIARQLSRVLQAKEPKIVNGPELFNKYVGETESNMRKLFEDARRDYQALREESPLHVIVFDEFDAIAKHRGMDTGGTGVGDNIVNQLLSVMDGVETLNNILVIGMTNRIDLIDKAVLRAGRFEVHVEVGLPNEAGRGQILRIHTKTMQTNGLLGQSVDLDALAAQMKNYTGAEIEAVVKSASSWALNRHHDLMNFTEARKLAAPGRVEQADFDLALKEVRPEFGVEEDKLATYTAHPLIDYGARLRSLLQNASRILAEAAEGRSRGISLLLSGAEGSGKTSLAAHLALKAKFPFVKLVSGEDLVGKGESYKVNFLVKCFEDAYKSPRSLVIVDDVERLCEYVPIGQRFNNSMLQALSVLVKKLPTKPDHSIAIIGTTANPAFVREFGLGPAFNVRLEVPELGFSENGDSEITAVLKSRGISIGASKYIGQSPSFKIGIKKLLFVVDMIKKNNSDKTLEEEFSAAIDLAGAEQTEDFTTSLLGKGL